MINLLKIKYFFGFIFCLNIFLSDFLVTYEAFAEDSEIKLSSEYIRNLPKNNNYILGPGDVLSIKVSDKALLLDSVFRIDGEGIANLKRLKRIYVNGLTISELTKILNKEYLKYVKEPNIELLIEEYRPIKVFLGGEVIKSGLFTLNGTISPFYAKDKVNQELTQPEQSISDDSQNIKSSNFPSIIDLIREGNGITPYSDISKIQIKRINNLSNGGGFKTTTTNLLKLLEGKSYYNPRIYDGDYIYIPKTNIPLKKDSFTKIKSTLNPLFINVFIGGRVESPGSFKTSSYSTFNEALLLAGDTKAIKGKAIFIRYKNNGDVDYRRFSINKNESRGTYNNPFLYNGDIIYVGKSRLNNLSELLTDVTAPLQPIVNTYGLYRILGFD